MKNRWSLGSMVVILAATVALSVTVAAAADQQVIKVGKKGEVDFDQPTQVGEITLKTGHYQMQHRVEGSDHMIHFTQLKGMQPFLSGPTDMVHAGEVKCHLEPMNAKASETTVTMSTEGGVQRITRIEIKGENVAHVF